MTDDHTCNQKENQHFITSSDGEDQQQQQHSIEAPRKNSSSSTTAAAASNSSWASRFKSKMCQKYETLGACPYNHRCLFAHGKHELRTKEMNIKDGLLNQAAVEAFQDKAHHDLISKMANSPQMLDQMLHAGIVNSQQQLQQQQNSFPVNPPQQQSYAAPQQQHQSTQPPMNYASTQQQYQQQQQQSASITGSPLYSNQPALPNYQDEHQTNVVGAYNQQAPAYHQSAPVPTPQYSASPQHNYYPQQHQQPQIQQQQQPQPQYTEPTAPTGYYPQPQAQQESVYYQQPQQQQQQQMQSSSYPATTQQPSGYQQGHHPLQQYQPSAPQQQQHQTYHVPAPATEAPLPQTNQHSSLPAQQQLQQSTSDVERSTEFYEQSYYSDFATAAAEAWNNTPQQHAERRGSSGGSTPPGSAGPGSARGSVSRGGSTTHQPYGLRPIIPPRLQQTPTNTSLDNSSVYSSGTPHHHQQQALNNSYSHYSQQ